jgi:hypothetical protein
MPKRHHRLRCCPPRCLRQRYRPRPDCRQRRYLLPPRPSLLCYRQHRYPLPPHHSPLRRIRFPRRCHPCRCCPLRGRSPRPLLHRGPPVRPRAAHRCPSFLHWRGSLHRRHHPGPPPLLRCLYRTDKIRIRCHRAGRAACLFRASTRRRPAGLRGRQSLPKREPWSRSIRSQGWSGREAAPVSKEGASA